MMYREQFLISRDDGIYEAFPDAVLTKGGKLICIFTECEHHHDRRNVRLVLCESNDRGRTWSKKRALTGREDGGSWNCARISRLADDSLAIVCDNITQGNNMIYIWYGDAEGTAWDGPHRTPAEGMVPDKLLELANGRWILASHRECEITHKLIQYCRYSDDRGKTWSEEITIASHPDLNLCEVSILPLPNGTLVAFMRENSFMGFDCFKAISYDNGESWQGIYHVPIPGCHRPVAVMLKSGKILIAFRFAHGTMRDKEGTWLHNFMAALTDVDAALALERKDNIVRIMPIDYDRNKSPDFGYSGIVQFEDGEIYIVNYIMDDSPKCQIRGYSLFEEDFVIESSDME